MSSVFKQKWRVALAAVALGSIGISGTAFAQVTGTPSGTTITNTATVNYTVGTVAQTAITASADFTVDTVIQFTFGTTSAENVIPGQTGLIARYTIDSASNIASNFQLALQAVGGTEDDFDMSNIVIRVDDGDDTYEASDPIVSTITGLESVGRTIWVTSDVPLTPSPADGDTSIIRLRATAIDPSTGAAWANDTGIDQEDGIAQIVVVNANGWVEDDATYTVQTATLNVTKSSDVVRDNLPGPPSANPKAIPGATVEYAIAIQNLGSQPATLNSINDTLPAATAFDADEYPGNADVSVQVNANPPTYCTQEADADGCTLAGTTLSVAAPAITTVAPGATITVRFHVTIN